ncbi:MAG: RNA methyltransferase [Bacteroidota bacterium]
MHWIGNGYVIPDYTIFTGMNEITQITSLQNPLVKQISTLREKSRERRKSGLFVLEGQQELWLALDGGYILHTVLLNREICRKSDFLALLKDLDHKIPLAYVSREVYQKLAYRKTTEGILALAHAKNHSLEQLKLYRDNPLILVAQAPEKPGNIGALLRTADAAHLDALIIVDPKTDLYNPNTIRSSVGGIFTNTIALTDTATAISFLKKRNIAIYCAALTASKMYTEVDFTGPTALIMGTEADGLSEKWLKQSNQNIIIPMHGKLDSLNVSVSASILIFEALRQRKV